MITTIVFRPFVTKTINNLANNKVPLDEGCQASPEVRMHILHRISLSSPR